MEKLTLIAKALSDPNRLKALAFLQNGEMCVCQIIAFLKLAPSTVSKHMSILCQAGLVNRRKTKQWAYYSLAEPKQPSEIKGAIKWVFECMKTSGFLSEIAKSCCSTKPKIKK